MMDDENKNIGKCDIKSTSRLERNLEIVRRRERGRAGRAIA